MSFQPFVPTGGIAGWRFLQRSQDMQVQAFNAGPVMARDTDTFLARIGQIRSAADLVADRTVLKVALGAFGLQDDIDNRAFIQRVLGDGTKADDALANRLSDKRYRAFSAAFGFGPGAVPLTGRRDEMEGIVARYRAQSFERALGEQDQTMQIALYAQRELPGIAAGASRETTRWYSVLGLPPLRAMFETAMGLPSSFSQLDLDKQVEVFRDKLQRATGSADISQFADPAAIEKLTTLYLARAQIRDLTAGMSSGATALTLLRGIG